MLPWARGHSGSGAGPPRCTAPCSPQSLYGVYYKCPCESGLSCNADMSIVGAITNSDFGICEDPADAQQSR